jgi:Putative auto-transporter adhesin, head GIN domain
MKKVSTTLILLAFVLVGVSQNREKRNVPSFTKVSFRMPGKLYLKQGAANSVELEGDKESLEKIEAKVEGGRLVIGLRDEDKWFNWRDWNNDKVTAYVTIKDVEGLSVSGSGDLIAQTKLIGSNMDLKVSGAGNLTAELEAGEVDADVSGSGDLNLRGKVKGLESDISGSGKISFDGLIAGSADVSISGAGKFMASGSASELKTNISGSGKILASELAVDKCSVKISGSGDVEVNVKSSIDANISGSGTVSYKGNPSQINSHTSGAGRIRKM